MAASERFVASETCVMISVILSVLDAVRERDAPLDHVIDAVLLP
jgi:hypothetical protein